MTRTTNDIAEILKKALCDAFSVDPVGGGEWVISSPFLHRDGDSFSLYLRRQVDGWLLTDDGSAASHLFFDDYELTDTRQRSIESIASVNGLAIDHQHALVRRISGAPDGFDVADLLLAMAQVGALPHIRSEQPDLSFRRAARSKVVDLLHPEQPREETWAPPGRSRWPVDLRMDTDEGPVVAFFVGNTARASLVAATIAEYREWSIEARPVVGFKPVIHGASIMRLQDVTRDDQAVVPVDTDFDSGLLGIRRVLSERGVRMAA